MTLLALLLTGYCLLDKQNFVLHESTFECRVSPVFCEDDPVGTKLILQCDA